MNDTIGLLRRINDKYNTSNTTNLKLMSIFTDEYYELCKKDKSYFISSYVPLYSSAFGFKIERMSDHQYDIFDQINNPQGYINIDCKLNYDDRLNVMVGAIIHNLIFRPFNRTGFVASGGMNRKMIMERVTETLIRMMDSVWYYAGDLTYKQKIAIVYSYVKDRVYGMIGEHDGRGHSFVDVYCIDHDIKHYDEIVKNILPCMRSTCGKFIRLCNTTKIV